MHVLLQILVVKKMQEEKVIMAKEMMKERLSLESVIKITKLSKAEIE